MILPLLIAQVVASQGAIDPALAGSTQRGWVIQALALQPSHGDPRPHKAYERLGIVQQEVLPIGDARLAVGSGERKPFLERTGIDPWETWRATEWVVPSGTRGRQFTHRGWLFCREDKKDPIRFPQCLRDADGDSRFDQQVRVAEGTLTFVPLELIDYDFGPADWPTNSLNYLGVQLTYERVGDDLEFFAQIVGSPGARVSITVPVSIAALPIDVRLLGAELSVDSWDGKRPIVTVKTPMATAPVRMVRSPLPSDPSRLGLRVELVEAPPLPGRLAKWRDAQRR